MPKCGGCPLAALDRACPGEHAPPICRHKGGKYAVYLAGVAASPDPGDGDSPGEPSPNPAPPRHAVGPVASGKSYPWDGLPAADAAAMKVGLLACVRACPHRGSVLPVSMQPGCGCRELTACSLPTNAGGSATLAECVKCVNGETWN